MSDEYMNENMNAGENNTSGTAGQTGNGNYSYNTGNNNEGYHSAYSTGYQSNNGGYTGGTGNGHGGKKHGGGGKIALAVIVAAAVGLAGGYSVAQTTRSGQDQTAQSEDGNAETEEKTTQEASAESGEATGEESSEGSTGDSLKTSKNSAVVTDVTQVVEDVMPSVVSVYNNFTQTTQDFFGQTYAQEGTSTGTGFIIAEDEDNDELLIATNNHVVDGADSLEVQFIDESTAEANIKGTDSSNDLAVIAVKLSDIDSDTLSQIEVATLGSSDDLKIGEPVVAIGNALGYGQSVTTGVVSALDREMTVESITGTFIQTDAAINPGNSGGPLVDLNGNVIGINSSKIGGDTVDSMGFAIPISRAVPIIQDLMNQKTKTTVDEDKRGYLGISGVSVTSQVASAYSMPEGVYVAQIIEGGAAENSDMQKGDIITAIEDSTVSDMEELQKQLSYYESGETVTLTVQRADGSGEYSEKKIDVTLGDKSTLSSYEESQKEQSKSRGKHSYGYNNNGGTSESSEDAEQSEEDSTEKEESSAESTESEDQESGSQYYSFPFGDLFGKN